MKLLIIFASIIFFIQSLNGQNVSRSQIIDLDLLKAYSKKEIVNLSQYVKDISFIPLATDPETVLAGDAEFEVTDNYIIVKNGKAFGKYQILLFDRFTGKFIREIGKQGRGPGQYLSYSYIPYNPVRQEIYTLGTSRQIISYDLSGTNFKKIDIPEWKDIGLLENNELYKTFQSVYVQYYNTLDTNIFVGYVRNYTGLEKRKIILFSKDGFLKVFPNYLTYKRENWRRFWNPPGQYAKFYKWNNELNFIEAFCDTLYRITKDNLIPRYYFNFGKFNPSYSKQPEIMLNKHWDEYFFIMSIIENQKYIFLEFMLNMETNLAIVDKMNNRISICSKGNSGKSALKDDVYGLLDVVPRSFTHNNEMVYIIKPVDLIKWVKENPKNGLLLRDRIPWLKEVDEFSNPIIAIAKCKD